MRTGVKVCVRSITYNHERFIRQCLDGIVMQKTDFPFVALVHDDASTDGTAAIVREYAEKYSDIIKPFFEKENQYSKKDGSLGRIMDEECEKYSPDYIAVCEGDDYWTDPNKLQRQVDFLDGHPDYSMCSHVVGEYNQNTKELVHRHNINDIEYSLLDVASGKHYFQTLSIMYRNGIITSEIKARHRIWQDIPNVYCLLKTGKGICFKEEMGVYRVHSGGVWSRANKDAKNEWNFKLRRSIYEAEHTRIAALGLVWCFHINRRWLILHPRTTLSSLIIIAKHFGWVMTINMFFKKIIIGRSTPASYFIEKYIANHQESNAI